MLGLDSGSKDLWIHETCMPGPAVPCIMGKSRSMDTGINDSIDAWIGSIDEYMPWMDLPLYVSLDPRIHESMDPWGIHGPMGR